MFFSGANNFQSNTWKVLGPVQNIRTLNVSQNKEFTIGVLRRGVLRPNLLRERGPKTSV